MCTKIDIRGRPFKWSKEQRALARRVRRYIDRDFGEHLIMFATRSGIKVSCIAHIYSMEITFHARRVWRDLATFIQLEYGHVEPLATLWTCLDCYNDKPEYAMQRSPKAVDGVYSQCKACAKAENERVKSGYARRRAG